MAGKSSISRDSSFAGFGPKALDFFRALGFHQDRAWFEENRGLYESDVKVPLTALLAELTTAFMKAGLPLRGNARSIFRLHRDVRFAKDKRPYKTNGGAVLTRDGTKKSPGLLYLHIDPEGCFMAAGFYRPDPDGLAALRRRIVSRPEMFRAAIAALAKAKLGLSDGDPLSRLPKGFESVSDDDLADALRRRSFVVRRPIGSADINRPAMVHDLIRFGREAAPLLRFGWDALDAATPDPRAQ